jgi:hypothetical protein
MTAKKVGRLTAYERAGDVQSGILRSGGQGSHDVTGYTDSHFLKTRNECVKIG